MRSRDLVKAEFDAAFYRERYGLRARVDPVEHFLTVGWIQGRDPSPHFSVFSYLLRNDDVLFRHLNPFVHYLVSGRDEGRPAFDHTDDDSAFLPWEPEIVSLLPIWFDYEYYLLLNPELEGSPNLLSQFLVLGWVEGRDPCEKFSTHKYIWKYSDVRLAGVNPLIHYLRYGHAEGREIAPAEGSRSKVQRQLSELEWIEEVNPSLTRCSTRRCIHLCKACRTFMGTTVPPAGWKAATLMQNSRCGNICQNIVTF